MPLGQIEVVGEAANGYVAIEKSLALKPDVVLMDIGLPLMDGIRATRIIKRSLPETRIIILTSHEGSKEVVPALAAGAHGFCRKDTFGPRLVEAISAVNRGVLWLDPEILKDVAHQICSLNSQLKKPIFSSFFDLSCREMEVLSLLTHGMKNNEIAEQLSISPSTIKTHVKNIMFKLNVNDRTQAAVKVMQGQYQLPPSFFLKPVKTVA